MRAERPMDWSEHDAFTGWRKVLAYIQRAGVRKRIKARSHRKDRRKAKQNFWDGWGVD